MAVGVVISFVAFYQVAIFSLYGKIASLMPASHGSHRFFSFGGVTFLRATGLFKHPVYLGEIGALGALPERSEHARRMLRACSEHARSAPGL